MGTTKLHLANGIQVVAQNSEGNNIVSFGIWLNFGSAYESLENNGMTHFLEHILCRQMFVSFIEGKGGYVECSTSREYLSINITIHSDDLVECFKKAIEDIYMPKITEEIIESEKNIVIEEINLYKANYLENALDNITQCLFEESNSFTYPILGNANTINEFTKKKLLQFWDEEILNSAIVVSVNGDIENNNLDQIVKYLEKLPKCNNRANKQKFISYPTTIVKETGYETSITNVLFGSHRISDKDSVKAEILTFHLTNSGQDSMLVSTLREKGLAYQSFSYHLQHSFADIMGITVLSDAKKVNDVIKIVNDTFDKAASISEDEFELLLDKTKKQISILYESTVEKMKFQANNQLFLENTTFLFEYLEHLTLIDRKSYSDFIKEIIRLEKGYLIYRNAPIK